MEKKGTQNKGKLLQRHTSAVCPSHPTEAWSSTQKDFDDDTFYSVAKGDNTKPRQKQRHKARVSSAPTNTRLIFSVALENIHKKVNPSVLNKDLTLYVPLGKTVLLGRQKVGLYGEKSTLWTILKYCGHVRIKQK